MSDLRTLRRSAIIFMFAIVMLAGLTTTRSAIAAACCGETFPLVFTPAPNRGGAVPLAGATISGSTHIFASPALPFSSIKRIDWWIDQTTFKKSTRFARENVAPYDLAGGSVAAAASFDTNTLSDGPHTITHRVIFSDRKRVLISTNFNVQNAPTALLEPYEFGVSERPDRAFASGALIPVLGDIGIEALFGVNYIFLADSATCAPRDCPALLVAPTISKVDWFLDDPTGAGIPFATDPLVPFDFVGTDTGGLSLGFDVDTLLPGLHTLTALITKTDTSVVNLSRNFLSVPLNVVLPGTLKGIAPDEDPKLAQGAGIIKNRDAAIALGRAFYWDLQTGGDGRQACASCHYHAGADNRILNTVAPGANGVFNAVTAAGEVLEPGDFPFHMFADALDRNSVLMQSIDDIAGSQGLPKKDFVKINVGDRADSFAEPAVADTVFLDTAGDPRRRVTGRNTPTNINAIYNIRSFWDGRANFVFNGVNNWGARDTAARIYGNDAIAGTLPVQEIMRIDFSSMASQAVGPPNNGTEMSYAGRTFPELGRKMISLRPLQFQPIAFDDSVFGMGALGNIIAGAPASGTGFGLDSAHMYDDLIRMAFADRLWNGGSVTIDGTSYTHMEANFSVFWGLAVQLWEATLVSDDSPWDRFRDGATAAIIQDQLDLVLLQTGGGGPVAGAMLTVAESNGMLSFVNGSCVFCHGGPVLSAATLPFLNLPAIPPEIKEQIVEKMFMEQGLAAIEVLLPNPPGAIYDVGMYNIGIRPTGEDPGVGGTDAFGNPLSFSNQLITGVHVDDLVGPLAVDTCKFGPPFTCDSPLANNTAVNGAFKTPSLRNVELTAPYFHNGGTATLEDVVAFYARGADFGDINIEDLDPEVAGIGNLRGNPAGVADLVAFLKTFTDERVRKEAAPFDHPGITLENGIVVDATGKNGGPTLPTFVNRLEGPTAFRDSYTTPVSTLLDVLVGSGVLSNDSDGTGEAVGDAMIVENVANGSLSLLADGSFMYTPAGTFRGVDGFAYDMADPGGLRSNVARVRIQVGNGVPVAVDDGYSVTQDSGANSIPVGTGVLFNDSDPEGDSLIAMLVANVDPAKGTLALAGDGSFVYTPKPGFNGTDGFTYTADDPDGPSNIATVTITVNPATSAAACPTSGALVLCFSLSSDRSDPLLLEGGNLVGSVYVFVSPVFPGLAIRRIDFFLDTTSLRGINRFSRENVAPYDLMGGSSAAAAPFSSATLAGGAHFIRAKITFTDGSSRVVLRSDFTH